MSELVEHCACECVCACVELKLKEKSTFELKCNSSVYLGPGKTSDTFLDSFYVC